MILQSMAKIVVQEHRYKPIGGRILCLGPQEISMSPEEVDRFLEGVPNLRPSSAAKPELEIKPGYFRADYFFSRFPIESLDSLDVVQGPAATIVHDLNTPIPEHLCDRFDFIVDGGTFDHLINLGIALDNIVKMLRPGGRILQYNAASNYLGKAYIMFGPNLFYDYYILNGFVDCKVYIARETVREVNAPWEIFYLPTGRTKSLNCAKRKMVIVIAEKGREGRGGRLPIQGPYRVGEPAEQFAILEEAARKSERPVLVGTIDPRVQGSTPPSWKETIARAARLARAGKFRFRRVFKNKPRKRKVEMYVGNL